MFECKHTDGINVKGPRYDELMSRLQSFGYKMVHTDSEDTTVELLH
jgi:hypothetical protein